MSATMPIREKKLGTARSPNTADRVNPAEWHFVQASTCRKFRIGEIVGRGELLGLAINGSPVYASSGGKVASVQYDFWREEVILEVTPSIPA